jgi:hypothetical protein
MTGGFCSPGGGGRRVGVTCETMRSHCKRHAGFGIRAGVIQWRIPEAHIDRMLKGESVEEIARNPSIPTDRCAHEEKAA